MRNGSPAISFHSWPRSLNKMLIEPLYTKRLIISELTTADFPAIKTTLNQNINILNYSAWNKIYPDPNNQDKFLLDSLSFQTERPRNKYVFKINNKTSGELIGTCSFFCSELNNNFLSAPNQQGDFRLAIAQNQQGAFYSLEVIEAIFSFGFEQLKKHRIVCYADKNNQALQLILSRAGMQNEALIRNYLYRDNQWHDHFLYAILEWQWRNKSK